MQPDGYQHVSGLNLLRDWSRCLGVAIVNTQSFTRGLTSTLTEWAGLFLQVRVYELIRKRALARLRRR